MCTAAIAQMSNANYGSCDFGNICDEAVCGTKRAIQGVNEVGHDYEHVAFTQVVESS